MQLWLCVMAKGSVRDGGWRVLEGRGDEGMGRGRFSQKKMKKQNRKRRSRSFALTRGVAVCDGQGEV